MIENRLDVLALLGLVQSDLAAQLTLTLGGLLGQDVALVALHVHELAGASLTEALGDRLPADHGVRTRVWRCGALFP